MNNPTITTEPSSGFADFVLRRLHVARIKAQITLNQLNTVDVALGAGWISGEDALAMLSEAGLLPLVEASS
jgi:hypothetical protein